MNDILTKISEAKYNYKHQYKRNPLFIFLGEKEQKELSEYLEEFAKQKELDIRIKILDKVLGMKIIAVEKESELKVDL